MAIQGLPGRPGRFQSSFRFTIQTVEPIAVQTFLIQLVLCRTCSGNNGRPGLPHLSVCFAVLVVQSRQWDQFPLRLSLSSLCFALQGSGTTDRPEPYKTSFCFAGHGSGTNSRPGLTQVRLCFATHGSGTNDHPGRSQSSFAIHGSGTNDSSGLSQSSL